MPPNVSRRWIRVILSFAVTSTCLLIGFGGCDTVEEPRISVDEPNASLDSNDVKYLVGRVAAYARSRAPEFSPAIAVTDREGNVLAVFLKDGADPANIAAAVAKARTAAFLSSNHHAFTTLTACFITRSHFPPGISNTPGGPLYGVPFSNLPGSDIQLNGSGLVGAPGGVPLFKNRCLVGGLGVAGGPLQLDLTTCGSDSEDELVALSALHGLAAPEDLKGDNILIDGIRFLYANETPLPASVPDRTEPREFGLFTDGPLNAPAPLLPLVGYIRPAQAGTALSKSEVENIIQNAAEQADRTRAAIRRPVGSPARVFITVVDVNGTVLGLYRTNEATIFSFDVSAQKARTVVAFSDPNHQFGKDIRVTLGVAADAPLAVTSRGLGFLSQDFFPPGIDRDSLGQPVIPGPFFGIQSRIGMQPYGNGITIFPGGIPLYKNGALVGGIGVSGDGVDQDDLIASAGAKAFMPPSAIRCDQYSYRGIRLPFIKIPRRPEL